MQHFKKYFWHVVTKEYFAFSGHANRPAFWWFVLYCILIGFIFALFLAPLSPLVSLLLFFPSMGISVRRLRDAGFSPWWLLTTLIAIGVLIVLVMCAMPSVSRKK